MLKEVLLRVMPVTNTIGVVTVSDADAYTPDPSCAVAVMLHVPAETPVTTPLLLTVATLLLDELQVIPLLVALSGNTTAKALVVVP